MSYYVTGSICLVLAISCIYSVESLIETIEIEGGEALLSFRCPSASPVPFSLAIGGRDPFYEQGQLILKNLSPSQQSRFRVLAYHSLAPQYTLVQIIIEKVEKTDGGSYTCKFYGTETIRPVLKEIALTVNFPPEKAQCSSVHSETVGWDEINCAAAGGSPPGEIICKAFKKGEVPLTQTPHQNETHILNTLILRNDTSVQCCSRNVVTRKDLTCNDFVLDRERMLEVETPSPKPSYDEVTSLATTTFIIAQTSKLNNFKIVIISVMPVLSVIVISLFVIRCFCKRKMRTSHSKTYNNVKQTDEFENNEQEGSGKDTAHEKEIDLKKQKLMSDLSRKPPETKPNYMIKSKPSVNTF